MDSIPTDVLRKIALEISPGDLLQFCLTNKRIKNNICNSNIFWRNKILVDYPNQKSFIYEYRNDLFQDNPKDLYKILTLKSKVIEIEKSDFPNLPNLWANTIFELVKEMSNELNTEKGKEFIKRNNLRRGDVLHLAWGSDYMNDDKYLWDGEKVVNLDRREEYCGSIPFQFSFPEFFPDYFSESIVNKQGSRYNIVRITNEKVDEAIRNFNVETQTSYITDKYNKYPIKLEVDILDIQIKFNRIFIFAGAINYNPYIKSFVLRIPMISTESEYHNGVSVSKDEFIPEWKLAIKEITTSNSYFYNTKYEWNGYTLKVTTFNL